MRCLDWGLSRIISTRLTKVNNMSIYKAIKRNIGSYLILCGLLGMAGTLQALPLPVQSSDTMDSYPREAHQQWPH